MSRRVHVVDLEFQGLGEVIAAFLVEGGGERVVLVETGPHSCYGALRAGVKRAGFAMGDVSDVLLTHIHFDHAGAAWAVARDAPGATVHVHPAGARHLVDPERLYGSATRIYGEAAMAMLWGEMHGIDEARVRTWKHGEGDSVGGLDVTAYHTPGHAKHHIAWRVGEAAFYGDAGGVRIGGGPVEPPCPPPDIDLAVWRGSIGVLGGELAGGRAFLTHFGVVDRPRRHLTTLRSVLDAWEEKARALLSTDGPDAGEAAFVRYVEAQRGAHAELYALANPAFMSWPGLVRALRTA